MLSLFFLLYVTEVDSMQTACSASGQGLLVEGLLLYPIQDLNPTSSTPSTLIRQFIHRSNSFHEVFFQPRSNGLELCIHMLLVRLVVVVVLLLLLLAWLLLVCCQLCLVYHCCHHCLLLFWWSF